ncbi:OmpL47-type beta-barrel domain-containing protein [Paenibacillus sp. 1011MAR3C5]|uniref:OmpL47-type beta-barrel domain-containing protein n=1 Tax=Paenibacillus sp. 1011MAR3C5 TaxID=1675787 RepID=UPI0016027F03|nr:S-layer homology domain-containing protein [Paenibacillus sp. 1011MAR3C5]
MIGIVPFQVLADSNSTMTGSGTEADPYLIMTLDQLNAVRNHLSAHYKLEADIDASETADWSNGDGFIPIGGAGKASSQFTGVFDGQGHVIRGLTIKQPLSENIGLFGIVGSSGVIRNVGLEGVSITGKIYIGGLAGRNFGSVDQSYVTGAVNSSSGIDSGIVGGLVGYNGIGGTITNSHAAGAVSGTTYVGGLVGRNDDTVSISHANGTVNGTSIVGGLVGDNEGGIVSQSYATSTVSGSGENVGGLVGYNLFNGVVSQSYATGAVSGRSYVGGLVGGTDFGLIGESYATGIVSGTQFVGGLVGYNYEAKLSNGFWDKETTGQSNACGYGTCMETGLTTAQALTQTSYAGWDFTNTWFIVDGSTRPLLRSEWSTTIRNAHHLQLMAMDLTANYTLAQNIDFGDTFNDSSRSDMWATSSSDGAGFAPIGSEASKPFTGSFNGQDHTIRNLMIKRQGVDNIGLFGMIGFGSVVHSVGLEVGSVSGHNSIGGLVGYNNGGTVDKAYTTAEVNGDSYVGGLVGYAGSDAAITLSHAAGSVSGSFSVGGLIGNLGDNSTVAQSHADGSVNGQFNVGGLAGNMDRGSTINQSYATGNIIGTDFIGGLVGRNEGGTLSNVYATSSVAGRAEVGGLTGRNVGDITHTYAVGSVTGSGDVGGLVGRNFGRVSASIYNKETTGQSDSGKGESRSTSEMKQRATFNPDWDFTQIWSEQEGKAYPVLQGIAANIGVDLAPPTALSAKIEGEHPDRVILSFDEEVSISDSDGVTINADGHAATITDIKGTGTKSLTFTVSERFEQGQHVLLSYDEQSGTILDLANNPMRSVTDYNVEHQLPEDKTPPTIMITMTKADGNDYEDGTWTNQSVTLSAAASDANGVSLFEYSLDSGATWRTYLSDIVLQDDGVYTLSFKAIDTAHNESVETRTVKLSTSGLKLTPTLTKADGSAYTSGAWTNASVTVSAYAEARFGEITGFTYTLDGETAQAYENKAPIVISDEGMHTIIFQAEDRAGNTLSAELTVKIDNTPPTIMIKMMKADENDYEDGTWTNQNVMLSAAASDANGVSLFEYSLDDGATWKTYQSDIVLRDDGIYTLSFKAIDAARNESVETRTVKISKSGLKLTPTLTKADGSAYTSGDWTNASVTVSVYAEAGFGEITGFTYTLDGRTAQAYENKAPIVISDEGMHTIIFQAEDRADNTLSAELTVKIDKTPPTIMITMTKADGNDYEDGTWTNQSVTLSAAASDANGVSLFEYSLDDGATWKTYQSDIVLRDDGIHTLSFKAIDAARNESVETRTVKISTSGLKLTPTLTKADGSAYTSGDWTNASVTVSAYAEAGFGEITGFTYTLDGGTAQTYENKAPIVISDEGKHTVIFQVEDRAGNTLSSELAVKIDKTPPTVGYSPNGSETWATSTETTVTVADTGSGADASTVQYAWTTDATTPVEGWMPFTNGAALTKSGADGEWYLHIRGRDLAGNVGNAASERFRLKTRESNPSSGSGLPSNTYLVGVEGSTISFGEGQIIIPAGAVHQPLYLTINEITGTDALPLSDRQRLISKVIEFKKDQAEKFDKDVTIRLRFAAESLREDNVEISLYWLNEATNEWIELNNIGIEWEKGVVSGTTDHFTKFAVIAKPVVENEPGVHFNDMKGHWAEENIKKLASIGAVNGYRDGTFKPDSAITRAEFTAILVRALGVPNKKSNVFTDMTNHWAREAISTANAYGIIHGYDQHTFAPDDFITREQIAVMVVNALQLEDVQATKTFADHGEISTWAQKAVVAAVEHGMIAGYPDNTMKPQAHATRAESVTIIINAIEKKRKIE